MFQYDVIGDLIQFALPLLQIHDFAIGEAPSRPYQILMLYGWRDTGDSSFFPNFFAAHRASPLIQRFRTLISQ